MIMEGVVLGSRPFIEPLSAALAKNILDYY